MFSKCQARTTALKFSYEDRAPIYVGAYILGCFCCGADVEFNESHASVNPKT
jgi:hypothetical protein